MFEEDVHVCNLYIPPVNSKVLPPDVDIYYEILEEKVLRYKNLGIYITGDFNGRTGSDI